MTENILIVFSSRTSTTSATVEQLDDALRTGGNTVTVSEASAVTDVTPYGLSDHRSTAKRSVTI
jgi:menaquinone-dependent protoporphyrinogen IX oxidase